jgi:hypothetical protein
LCPEALGRLFHGSFDDWRQRVNARVVNKQPLNLRAARGPLEWCLVKLN